MANPRLSPQLRTTIQAGREIARLKRVLERLRAAVRDSPCPYSACCKVYAQRDWRDESQRLWCWKARALGWHRETDDKGAL